MKKERIGKELCKHCRKGWRVFLADNFRNGMSTLPLVILAGIFAVASVSFISIKLYQDKNSGNENDFLSRAAASVSKAFENIFSIGSIGEKQPEINPAADIKSAAEKISAVAPESKVARPGATTDGKNSSVTSSSTANAEKKISSCDFSRTGVPHHQIIFSEINWTGDKESANNEWMELKNNSSGDISLGDWRIMSEDGNINATFGAADKIPQGALYLLERTRESAPGVAADKIYSGALPNSGSWLKIFDSNCNLSDEIDASKKWPAGDAAARKTMERSVLDLSWHTSAMEGGTPKKENSAAFATKEETINFAAPGGPTANQTDNSSAENQSSSSNSPNTSTSDSQSQQTQQSGAATHILIAEIQITGGSGKSDNDFIKIFNAGGGATDVGGWQLKKRNASGTESSVKVFSSGSVVANQAYFTWANSESGFASTTGANTSSTQYLSDNNSVALFDNSGNLIDAVAWGSGHLNPFVENSSYPTNPGANQILSRKIIGGVMQDTDNNQNDFEIK